MPLTLHNIDCIGTYLAEILQEISLTSAQSTSPSTLFLVPHLRAAQDLQEALIQEKSPGILLGPLVQTLEAWAEFLLEAHPDAKPLLSWGKQGQLARQILKKHDRALGAKTRAAFFREQSCLLDQQQLLEGPLSWKKIPAPHQAYLDLVQDQGLATREQSQNQAWQLLSQQAPALLKPLQSIHFLGWHYPTGSLRAALTACLQGLPQVQVHLYLAPVEQITHPGGEDQNFWEFLFSQVSENRHYSPSPTAQSQYLQYPSTLHESAQLVQKIAEPKSLILLPAQSESFALMQSHLEAQGLLAPKEKASLKQIYRFLGQGLLKELPDINLSLSQFAQAFQAYLQNNLEKLLQESQAGLLKHLKKLKNILEEFSLLEEEKAQSPQDCFETILDDLDQDQSALASLPQWTSLKQAGLKKVPQVYLGALNQENWPPPHPLSLFSQTSTGLWQHKHQVLLSQVQKLAEEKIIFSHATLNLSGKNLSPLYLGQSWQSVDSQQNPLATQKPPPYFVENLNREKARLHASLGPDQGDLSLEKINLKKHCQAHPLSPSALDLYSDCPWRFFAARFLELEAKEDTSLQSSALDLGAWAHDILEKTYAKFLSSHFCQGKIPSLEALHQQAQDTWQKGFSAKKAEAKTPAFFYWEAQQLLKQIKALLASEHQDWQNSPDPLLPHHLEASFGSKQSFKIVLPQLGEVAFRGVLDRVDQSQDGLRTLVLDYKSGETKTLAKKIREAKSFQLYLYLKALPQILDKNTKAIGGLYWSLKNNQRDQGMVLKAELAQHSSLKVGRASQIKEEQWESYQKALEESLSQNIQKIFAGDFRLEPQDCAGIYCPYQEICRYEG